MSSVSASALELWERLILAGRASGRRVVDKTLREKFYGSGWLSKIAVGSFFLFLTLLGLLVYRDFGVSWDEPALHDFGSAVLRSVFTNDHQYEQIAAIRTHGPLMVMFFGGVDRIFALSPEARYPLGHLLNYMVFLGGLTAFFALCSRQFGGWYWGLLGSLFLVLSPRIFSHAFVNLTDAPLMGLFSVSMYFLIVYSESGHLWKLALAGLFAGLATDTRVAGLGLATMTLIFILIDGSLNKQKSSQRYKIVRDIGVYCASLVSSVLLFWPYLWSNPWSRLKEAISTMSHFDLGPTSALYMGKVISLKPVPWHYLPTWIVITTPITLLFLATVGAHKLFVPNLLQRFRTGSPDRFFYLYGAWLIGPLIAVPIARAVVYDEWRHVLFVYPPLIIFSVAGALFLSNKAKVVCGRPFMGKALSTVLLLAAIIGLALKMVGLHPYEALYFNKLVGGVGGAQKRFELDYWGLSYREGLGHLLKTIPGGIKVNACTYPAEPNAELFPDRYRLHLVPRSEADYAICAPRSTPEEFLPDKPTIYKIGRDGGNFLFIKDLRGQR